MSTRGAGLNGSAAKRQRAGGGAAGPAQRKPYFDDLSEDLIEDAMSFLSVRDLDVARFPCKVFNLVARRFVAWIGVAPAAAGGSSAGGGASGGLPAHMKRNLQEALVAFERFRAAHPGGRVLEIRLTDHVSHTTGWELAARFRRPPGKIGGGDYGGLQLDGADRWEGLRIVTPEVDVVYGKGSRYSVVVRDGVTSIGNFAFNKCTGLTSVTFPEGLTSIGERAFEECTGLTSVTFSEGLTSIGVCAFEYCTGLTSVTFPQGLQQVGERAFCECSLLTSVTLPQGCSYQSDSFPPGCSVVVQ